MPESFSGGTSSEIITITFYLFFVTNKLFLKVTTVYLLLAYYILIVLRLRPILVWLVTISEILFFNIFCKEIEFNKTKNQNTKFNSIQYEDSVQAILD